MNYEKLIKHKPTVYDTLVNSKGQTIELVEHPINGDESDVIAICHNLKAADYTGFFDTEDMMADHQEYEPWFDELGKLHIGKL